jgi:hypothetical protein
MKIYKAAVKAILNKGWNITVKTNDGDMISDNKYCKKYKEIISDIECCEMINAVIHDSSNKYLGIFSVINDSGLDDDEWINDFTISKKSTEWNNLMNGLYN